MRKNTKILLAILAITVTLQQANAIDLTAADKELYEKYGLSETEWIAVKENGISETELKEILLHGVSVLDYIEQPYKKYGISRQEWLKLLRNGYTPKDIDMMYSREEHSTDNSFIPAFFLPGLYQYKREQKIKGAVMASTTLASLTLFAFHHQESNSTRVIAFNRPFPWLFTMMGTMLWSSIDIGIQIQRETNPDAARFSFITDGTRHELLFTTVF